MKLNCEIQIMDMSGDLVVIPVGNDDFRGVLNINGVTADILKLLEEDTTEDDIVAALKKEYDATDDQLRHSVKKVVDVLKENNLVYE